MHRITVDSLLTEDMWDQICTYWHNNNKYDRPNTISISCMRFMPIIAFCYRTSYFCGTC